jgi:DegV family protein with EDD domain
MKIALSAESSIDLPKELLSKYDISTVPFTVVLGEETGLDGVLTVDDLYSFTDRTGKLAKTSAVNTYQYEEHFRKILQTSDCLIHFSISSELSSAYQNAVVAANEDEFKGKVFVIDTKNISTGIALLAIYARKLVDSGLPPEEIVKKVESRSPFLRVTSCLEAVEYLYKGGRCSLLSLLGANLLRIRPEIGVRDGKMVAMRRYRGKMVKAVADFIEDVLNHDFTPDKFLAFVTYSTSPQGLTEQVRERLLLAGFQNVIITRTGCTIGCYTGPSCLGLSFFNDGPH